MKIKRIEESNFYGESSCFLNDETGDKYGRIVGGLGFPVGDRPGYLVVIAEQRTKEHGKKPKFWVLDTYETFNMADLLNSAIVFGRKYFLHQTFSDMANAPLMSYVYKLRVPLALTNPPFIDETDALNGYITTIRGLTTPGRKRLFFSGSDLGTRLLEIPAEKIRRAKKVQDFPLLMALGGALSALITYAHSPDEQRSVDRLNEELAEFCDYD
jgi:hypothetical protein